ncbi:MAG: RHS repeat-associated core domain-containing protein [Planctomyces sp.]|nr:RHS repeat-associated core domain-containing protein [Planctomyces sp.]
MSDTRTMSLYEAAGQTTVVRSPNSQSVTFTYTAAGQRRSMDATNSGRSTYTYVSANQLNYGQVTAGRTTYTYDLTGNQQIEQPPTGNRTTTTWNYENQPTQYRLPTGLPVTMAYNGDNRRISLVQGTSTTKFVWDPVIDAYIQELDGSNVLIATYTNEPQQYGGVLSQRRGSTSSFLHADALGTTRLLTSTAGATTDTYLLDAWGNPVSSTGSTVNPFRWVGRSGYYTDAITGLIYVRARMYMPTIARWSSVDPLGFVDGPNLFSYGQLRPPLVADPGGQQVLLVGFEGTGAYGYSPLGIPIIPPTSDKDIQDSYLPIAADVLGVHLEYRLLPQVVLPVGFGKNKANKIAEGLKRLAEARDPECPCCYRRTVLVGFSYGALTAIWVLEALQQISTVKIDLVFLIDAVANDPWEAGAALKVKANNYCRMVNVWQSSAEGGVGFEGTKVDGADVNQHFSGEEIDGGPFKPYVDRHERIAQRRHPNLPKLIAVQEMFRREVELLESSGTSKERPQACGADDVCGNCT